MGLPVVEWSCNADRPTVWGSLVGNDRLPEWLGKPMELDVCVGGKLVIDRGGG